MRLQTYEQNAYVSFNGGTNVILDEEDDDNLHTPGVQKQRHDESEPLLRFGRLVGEVFVCINAPSNLQHAEHE